MSPSSNVASTRRTLLAFIALLALSPNTYAEPAEILGAWSGKLHHADQTTPIGITLRKGRRGLAAVTLTLPAIDVYDYPIGRFKLRGDTARLGPWLLELDRRRGLRLKGTLPESWVPIHSISFSLEKTPLTKPASKPLGPTGIEPFWTAETGGEIWAGLETGENLLFVGSDDGILRALQQQDGRVEWQFSAKAPIRARPTFHDGAIFLHADDGRLHRLDARSGKAAWTVPLQPEPKAETVTKKRASRYDHYSSSPVIAEGLLYVGTSNGIVFALDPAEGEERWRFDTGDTVSTTPCVANGRIFFGSFSGKVFGLSRSTGKKLWEYETLAPVTSSPAVAHDKVLVGSRNYDLLALDASSGEVAWSRYHWFSWVESSVTIDGSTAYIGTSDSQSLQAHDVQTGRQVWKFDSGGSVWAQPAVADDAVFMGAVGVPGYLIDHRGSLNCVERATGELRWRYETAVPSRPKKWGFAAAPASSDGRVFAGGLDGRIYAFPTRPETAETTQR